MQTYSNSYNGSYAQDLSQNYGYTGATNNDTFYQNYAYNDNTPGTWTLREEPVSAVPVPAALPLMASALGLFGFIKRRKQSV